MLRVITGNAYHFNPLPPHGGRRPKKGHKKIPPNLFQSTPSAWRETRIYNVDFYILPLFQSTPSAWRETMRTITSPNNKHISIHSLRMEGDHKHDGKHKGLFTFQSTPSAWRETDRTVPGYTVFPISIHSLRMEGDSKTAQESVFHFAYPCTILQKRMQKTTFCTRKNGFFRKKGEKFGAKPSASFCAPMIRTDTFPLNFSHRISGSSMSMVSFAPICSTFD